VIVERDGTYVAAAYPNVRDSHEDVMCIDEFGNRLVLEFCIFGAVEDDGRVLHLLDGC
jgi:hypothetical protein